MSRILLLNQYYYPDVAATAQLAADLGHELALRGHEVMALASARPYSGSGWRPLAGRHGEVKIVRVPATAIGRGTRGGRLLDYATFAGLSLPLLAAVRPDVVVALSTPPMIAALALLVQRLRDVRFVYWVMDVYPEIAVELGAMRGGSRMERALSGLSRALYARADAVVALDDAMRDRLVAGGAAPAQVEVIDNWPPALDGIDEIRPVPRADNVLRRELRLSDRFAVSYSGNMGLGHDFATLIETMRLLRQEEIDWLFIGDGPRRAELERAVLAHSLPRVRFLGYCARADLSTSLSAADASLITLEAGVAGLLAPSKLYGLLAAGVPLLYVGPETGRAAEVVERERVGFGVRNGDAAGLATAILKMKYDVAGRKGMSLRARLLFEQRFTRQQALARHCALIARMAERAC